MKTLRSLFVLLVVSATLSAFATPPTSLEPKIQWTFAQGSTLNLTFTPDAGNTYYWAGYDATGNAKFYPVGQYTITIPNVTQACQGTWTIYGQNNFNKKVSMWCYYVKITSNLVVPDLVVTGSVGTGVAATTNVYFTTTGTQTAIVGFKVKGPSLGTAGLATPKVQLLNDKGVVVASGVIASGVIAKDDYLCRNIEWAFCPEIPAAGNAYMFATIGPGIYTVVVTTATPGKTGTFQLDMSPYN